MKQNFLARWRAYFFAGLFILLPGLVSIFFISWLFSATASKSDWLLIFIPREITHEPLGDVPGLGPMYWYWSVVALLLAMFLIAGIGFLGRNYFGKKLIEFVDSSLMKIPLLNKIYSTTKQVNDAFHSGSGNAFKTVVMVEFPRKGMHSIGFVTSELNAQIKDGVNGKLVCVFIPTTPNPTSGFMMMVPENELTVMDMTAADGMKFIISLGSISPEYSPEAKAKLTPIRS